jgi:hypothetical protein
MVETAGLPLMNLLLANHRRSSRLLAVAASLVMLFSCTVLVGQTTNTADEIPPLRPPRAELPPSFWEQNRNSVVLTGVAVLLFIIVVVWFLTARRPAVALPPEVIARQALESLRSAPEEGLLLSRVSRILRRYLADAFQLTPGESTTTEFCSELAANAGVGLDLAEEVSVFLRQCDQRKFAPSQAAPELGAVGHALKLVDAGEARRAALRMAATAAPAGDRAAT